MLEGVAKFPGIARVLDQAKGLTVFVYAHHKTLYMMRTYTKKRDIVRPGATRFATCFLTLHSLYEKKAHVKAMFTSDEWHDCKHSKCVKGKSSLETVMSFAFWNSVMMILKIFSLMVKILKLADGEKIPSLGYICGEILEAKKTIIHGACDSLERNYQPIIEIMDEKMKGRLDGPLHLAAYFLNPYYFYNQPSIQHDLQVIEGFMICVETFYHGGFDKQYVVVNQELRLYKNGVGSFGRALAIKASETKENFDPGNWWSTYGCGAPLLQRLATRILALCSSSSGCERNWSSFEGIHTKKWNRLDVNRLNSLDYVQFNARLFSKHKKIRENYVDLIFDEGYEDTFSEWLVEQHDPALNLNESALNSDGNTQGPKLRDLYDDDFGSDEEELVDMEFEPDKNFDFDCVFRDTQ